jgi:hypothetical protein
MPRSYLEDGGGDQVQLVEYSVLEAVKRGLEHVKLKNLPPLRRNGWKRLNRCWDGL